MRIQHEIGIEDDHLVAGVDGAEQREVEAAAGATGEEHFAVGMRIPAAQRRGDFGAQFGDALGDGIGVMAGVDGGVGELEEAQKEQILEHIRARFADRKFVAEIVIVPDYYLTGARGFDGLQGVQRLYNIDLMALVSYDQVTHLDDNRWSLTYLTIIGAYVIPGSSHDVATLVDLAVVDPATRSLVLRAGGTDTRLSSSTLIDRDRDARTASAASFGVASQHMIDNFDAALGQFEASVKAGHANVRVVNRAAENGGRSGGGSLAVCDVLMLLAFVVLRRVSAPG